jgi:hypothetical protein
MAMYSSSVVKQKLMAEVDVTLSDGSILKGNFFLNPQERIIDMLNDDRHFLPFSDSDGVITVVAKVAITSIRPTQQTDDGKTEEPPRRIGM